MKKLLDKPFHLILKLLEHFYKKTPQETINYYSDFLNVDRRTILKIITDLERDIADCQWENQLTLEVTETKIIATFSTNFSLENFYRYYMERSLCVELVQSIFKEAEISLDQIISLPFMNHLSDYFIKIDNKNNENKLKKRISINIQDKYEDFEWYKKMI